MPVRFSVLFLLILSGLYCRSAVINSADIVEMNQELSKQQFRAIQDIKPEFARAGNESEASFPAGTLLKLRVESASGWVRVRARKAAENEEQTPGTIIIYLFREDLPADGNSAANRSFLMEKIRQKVSGA